MNEGKDFFVRKTVAEKLKTAYTFLPKGCTFIVTGAWRSATKQKKFYDEFFSKLEKMHPSWRIKVIHQEVRKYIHPHKGKLASGHLTGGAVDLRLWRNGRRIPMVSSKLSYEENYMTEQRKLPPYLIRNRELLYHALRKVGFVNYPKEFWHWSYGDLRWARATKHKTAIYGVVEKIKHS